MCLQECKVLSVLNFGGPNVEVQWLLNGFYLDKQRERPPRLLLQHFGEVEQRLSGLPLRLSHLHKSTNKDSCDRLLLKSYSLIVINPILKIAVNIHRMGQDVHTYMTNVFSPFLL